MTLLGLAPVLWSALAAVSVLLVVGLHLLRERRQTLTVVYLALWEKLLPSRAAQANWRRLKRWLALLLSLAIVGSLLVAAGDPRPKSTTGELRFHLVLLDVSASMQAKEGNSTRFEQGKLALGRWLKGLGSRDRVLLVAVAQHAEPLGPWLEEPSTALSLLSTLQPVDSPANWSGALEFADEILASRRGGDLIVVSDRAPTLDGASPARPQPARPRYLLPVGHSGGNLAITSFAARRTPGEPLHCELQVEVLNADLQARRAELILSGDAGPLSILPLTLAPGQQWRQFVPDIPASHEVLTATLHATDGLADRLALDDVATTRLPERHRSKLLLVTSGNTYLSAALLLDELLDITTLAPGARLPEGPFELAIFDGVANPGFVGPQLLLAPPVATDGFTLGRSLTDFGFDDVKDGETLVRGLRLEDVQVQQGRALKPLGHTTVLGSSQQGPLLLSGQTAQGRFIALGFSPQNSDFVLRPAFPMFVLKAVNLLLEREARFVSSLRTGELQRLSAPEGASHALLREPSGRQRLLPVQQGLVQFEPGQVGRYALEFPGTPEARRQLEVNLANAEVSQLNSDGPSPSWPRPPAGESHRHRPLGWLALVLALLLMLLEGLALRRRWLA